MPHKHGNTITEGLTDRFKKRIDVNEYGCWVWKSSKNKSGTPIFTTSLDGTRFVISARRFCWEQLLGNVLHRDTEIHVSCGNNLCVNPQHLYEQTIFTRLEKNMIKDIKTGCWIWNGHISERYGTIRFKNMSNVKVHRVMWELFKGNIPEGIQVLHECDNPLCVNPDHLFLGTRKDNMLDMVRKDRCGKAKLQVSDVKAIRMALNSGVSINENAKAFNVSEKTIQSIQKRRTWVNID